MCFQISFTILYSLYYTQYTVLTSHLQCHTQRRCCVCCVGSKGQFWSHGCPWRIIQGGRKTHESPLKIIFITMFSRSWERKKRKHEQFQGLEEKSNIAVNKWVNSPVVDEKWVILNKGMYLRKKEKKIYQFFKTKLSYHENINDKKQMRTGEKK